ncbi:hypothetical protein [Ruegeria atlantica]|uniref:Putative transmembrane transcriptional regulator (Anti-sigma factor) n=1 Tax=Ruegeria atlantica TaxID=81569 RepID=A0A0N7LQ70_9RHOB|nr:hypothetical protein [Ruegeria atlantica]CUH47196.1 putative transmembrane transcriptional regulator (anti-sigma factor) [Ruegeria atlantica]
MKFSDETLRAYLEGNADAAEAAAIEAAIETDLALEQRLMTLDPLAPVVQSVFENIPADAPQLELPQPMQVSTADASGGLWRLMAVAASVAVVAVSATFWATRPEPMGWAEQAAIYQSLYSPDTIESLDSSPVALDAQFARAEAQLGRSLNRDTLETLPGLELKRAQVLSFKGKPLIQVVFADDQGQPLAFCVIRQGEGAPAKDVKLAAISGVATATWAQDGYGYMLIGSSEQTDLDQQLNILTTTFAG